MTPPRIAFRFLSLLRQFVGRVALLWAGAALLPLAAADAATHDAWYRDASQALNDADQAKLLQLLRDLPKDEGAPFLGEIPVRIVEAGWTNAFEMLVTTGILATRQPLGPFLTPETRTGSGSLVKSSSPTPIRTGPTMSVTVTEVLAVAARLGNANFVQRLLNAGADPSGPTRMGSRELSPLLNAMISPPEVGLSGRLGRPREHGSVENRRTCLDLLLGAGASLLIANNPVPEWGMSRPTRDLASWSRVLEPELLDYALTNTRPVTQLDSQGQGLLHLAVACKRAAVVEALVGLGIPIDQPDGSGQTPLQLLASAGGVDPLSSTNSKPGLPAGARGSLYRPAPEFVRSNRLAMAAALFKSGARPDVFTAAGLDDTNTLARMLRENPTAVSSTNRTNQTPLHWAVRNASVGATALLLSAGASVNAPDTGGFTPMHSAVGWWPNSVLPLLLQAGASFEVTNHFGETPMMAAMRIPEVLQLLAKSRPGDTPGTGRTNLFIQAIEGLAGKEALQTLFDAGERLEPLGPDGQPLIFWILKQPFVTDSLIFLAGKGLDVQARDARGNTALHVMADRLGDDVYINPDSMMQRRARIGNGEPFRRSQQAMKRMVARTGRRPSFMKETRPLLDVLLELGVDVAATNHAGQTAEQLVTQGLVRDSPEGFAGRRTGEGFDEVLSTLRVLREKGLPRDTRDRWGMTPLLEAVRNHNYRLARELIQLGSEATATNMLGESAFHLLSHGRWRARDLGAPEELKSLIKELLARGLDPKLRNIHGLTAREEMQWNAQESRLEYYANGDTPPGSRWPLVEAVEQLEPGDAATSTNSATRIPDYTAGTAKSLLRVFLGPQSAVAMESLMDSGERLDFLAPDGRPLIHWIIEGSLRLDLLPILTLLGLDLNARDEAGRTVLDMDVNRLGSWVSIRTDPPVLEKLAGKSAAASQALAWLRGTDGEKTFVSRTNLVLMDLLWKVGVAGGWTNRWGQTMWHLRNTGSPESMKALIKPGAPFEARDRRGMTPLLSAVGNRQYSVALAMLEAGADPLATNRVGDTAFHLLGRRPAELKGASIEPELEQLLRMLLQRGLDPRRRNLMGFTALEDARIWFQREFAHGYHGPDPVPAVILERMEKLDAETL